ncbi:hypothetical protein [Sorangium sp. So ce388]|uniref:hypothetical protein n=1 Tax=Sorangium sp. So ce388 TaxID=3133309 RepID=UPI003F5C9373
MSAGRPFHRFLTSIPAVLALAGAIVAATPGCDRGSATTAADQSASAVAYAPVASASAAAPPGPVKPAGSSTPDASQKQSPAPIVLSPNFPGDVTVTNGAGGLPAIQADFDVFSWNSFIAANWPPGPDGGGDPKQTIGAGPIGDNPTVWEGWISTADVFLDGGKTPSWGAKPEVPAACQGVFKDGMRILRQVGKTPGVLTDTNQPFKTGPLIDQSGNFVRYDIVINRPMFDYIVTNGLYSKKGQKAFKDTVKFPCGAEGGAVGAVMIKAAWKVLADPTTERARFHSADVLLYTPPSTTRKIEEKCEAGTVGLVGLHIAHKTNDAAQWVWSTFEHVDNAPRAAEAKKPPRAVYNFFNPACGADCPPDNTAAPRPWNPNVKNPNHTQVVRVDTLLESEGFIPASAKARNDAARALLVGAGASSVWQYYELESTQWPTDTNVGKCEAKPANPSGTPAPTFLANTTMETYIQGTTPGVSSSCIGCHGNAAMTNGAASDFTYVLQVAK